VETSFAWAELAKGSIGIADGMPAEGTRCRRLVKDYERCATTLAGFHVIAFIGYMLKHAVALMQGA
jgi:hypothetical protein